MSFFTLTQEGLTGHELMLCGQGAQSSPGSGELPDTVLFYPGKGHKPTAITGWWEPQVPKLSMGHVLKESWQRALPPFSTSPLHLRALFLQHLNGSLKNDDLKITICRFQQKH